MKIKQGTLSKKDLERIKEIQINKCKSFLNNCPFATPVYLAMQTKIPFDFIINNRKEIGI